MIAAVGSIIVENQATLLILVLYILIISFTLTKDSRAYYLSGTTQRDH
ncbi:hypothetical protein [Nocardiopsis mwathae]|nr:hypothetical protein [Nocardiopsis mwathae]